jgi:uncharacterized repeat protein (TIGR01451 family)/fimbrial isopeptide formation D2 family protein/uncharacterized repeat protein (TIGR02543 family)
MRKIFSILFALVLVLGFVLAMAAPAGANMLPTPLDHFTCYLDNETAPYIGEVVYLEDQFCTVNATVGSAMAFANPAAKQHGENMTPISNPDHHLTIYFLEYEGEPQMWQVEVDNQFGTQQLTVWGPVGLAVPTQKEGHEAPVGLDHYLLYYVEGGSPVEEVVGLNDEFGSEPVVWVLEPYVFASPVRKTHDGKVTEIVNPEAYAVIYSIYYEGEPLEKEIGVVNQFGAQNLTVSGPYALAVPSEMKTMPPTPPDVAIWKWGWRGVSPGETMDYGIQYSNRGGTPAQDVTIVDHLPSQVDYVSSTGGTYSSATHTVSWNLGTLNPYQGGILVITVCVHSGLANGTQLEDIVNISTSSQDSDLTNNESRWITVIGAAHDPNDKAVSPEGHVQAGQTLDYTVRYENEGAGKAFGVYVTDVLDEDLDDSTLVIDGGGSYNTPTRTITWTIGEVGPGEGGTLTFSANVRSDATPGTVVTNYATVYFPSAFEETRTNIVVNTVPCHLTVSSTAGGNVTTPGEGTFPYDVGTVVNLVATPSAGYQFVKWTGNVTTIANVNAAATNITMNGDYSIRANFEQVPPSGGGCFIATAAYGTPMAKEIQILREFRDKYLLTNPVGRAFVDFYYKTSPPIAKFITEHPILKPIVRAGLVPAVAMSTIAINTTPAEKAAIVGLLVLVSVALAVWATRRRGRGPEYS